MYFLYKEGVYGHGVFWIGDDLEEGRRRADSAANLDIDDYHEWGLYKFIQPTNDTDYEFDPDHEQVYMGKRRIDNEKT